MVQRSTVLASRSFWRAVAVMGRCWQARFTQAMESLERRWPSRKVAQVGVGVEVAGEGLDRGTRLVALVLLLEGHRLGDQEARPE